MAQAKSMAIKRNIIGTLALGILVVGCTSPGTTGTTTSGTSSTPVEKESLSVKGSDTMVQLAQAWAEEFKKAHPEFDVTVTGGGSNTGIAAIINKGTDIANASRPMKKEELEDATKNGVEPKEFVVAQDALTIIVNSSNTISELTLAQLKDIYTGKVTNWKDVGGQDTKIVATSRESSSGTYVFFQEHVMNKDPYATSILASPGTSQIVDGVSQDAGGIGYVGLGYVTKKVKTVAIKKDIASPAIHGSVATVLDGTYSLARPLLQYTAGEPTGATKTWIDWVTGPEGQAVVDKMGFVRVK